MSAGLDTPGMIAPPDGADEGGPGGGAGRGQAPPPQPTVDNMSPEALRMQAAAIRRRQRQARRQAVTGRVRSIHRQWWWAGATIVGLTVGAVGCQRWQEQQTATTLALAEIATADRTPVAPAVTPTTAVGAIPNPLDSIQPALTAQARWLISVGADGVTLQPKRSAAVVAAMLSQVDPCKLFLGLDDTAGLVVSREPRPGYVPLSSCAVQPSTTTTTAKAAA